MNNTNSMIKFIIDVLSLAIVAVIAHAEESRGGDDVGVPVVAASLLRNRNMNNNRVLKPLDFTKNPALSISSSSSSTKVRAAADDKCTNLEGYLFKGKTCAEFVPLRSENEEKNKKYCKKKDKTKDFDTETQKVKVFCPEQCNTKCAVPSPPDEEDCQDNDVTIMLTLENGRDKEFTCGKIAIKELCGKKVTDKEGKTAEKFCTSCGCGVGSPPVPAPTPTPTPPTPLVSPTPSPLTPLPPPTPTTTSRPTAAPSDSSFPSSSPTTAPSDSSFPSSSPSTSPSESFQPSDGLQPSTVPSTTPSHTPSFSPSFLPSAVPSSTPSIGPSQIPSVVPSAVPSFIPSAVPSQIPSVVPSTTPSNYPSGAPVKRGKCDNLEGYTFKNKKDQDCETWVAADTKKLCKKRDTKNDNEKVKFFCPAVCNWDKCRGNCDNKPGYGFRNNPDNDCASYATSEKKCKKKDNKNGDEKVSFFCPQQCKPKCATSSPSTAPSDVPSVTPTIAPSSVPSTLAPTVSPAPTTTSQPSKTLSPTTTFAPTIYTWSPTWSPTITWEPSATFAPSRTWNPTEED